jgi:hypothetical protein
MSNDLTFAIIALEKVDTALNHVAERLEMLETKVDRLNGKKAKLDVDVDTDKAGKGLDLIQSRWQAIAAAIIVASPVIGAAVLAGVGTAFVGTAVLAQKSNIDVQQSFAGMWTNVVGTTRAATDHLVPQLVGAGNAIGNMFQEIGPQLTRAMSFAGPQIVAITRGITELATNAMPGLVTAMQSIQPVMSATANFMGLLGSVFSDTVSSLAQHSAEYATVLQSVGSITQSVFSLATQLINDLAVAYAQNSAQINSSIAGITGVIAKLASGVLPVLTAAMTAAGNAIKTITDIIGPWAPLFGFVATGALALWGAFKLADLATVGVTKLGAGISWLGTQMITAAAGGDKLIVSLGSVAAEASATSGALAGVAVSAGEAAVGMGAATRAMAGPLGIALVIGSVLLSKLAGDTGEASQKTQEFKAKTDELTASLIANHGAVDQHTRDLLTGSDAYKAVAGKISQFGVSQKDLTDAIMQGGPALDGIKARLKGVTDAATASGANTAKNADELWKNAKAADEVGKGLDGLVAQWGAASGAANEATAAQKNTALVMAGSTEATAAASGVAASFGMTVGSVQRGLYDLGSAAGNAGLSVEQLAVKFRDGQIAIGNAAAAITDHFEQADKAVASAQEGVDSASHAYTAAQASITDAHHSEAAAARGVAQAEQGVAQAQHSVAAAQRGVQDAVEGVDTARKAYAKSLLDEKKAEADLHAARQQAVQDLKDLHLQLEDQVVSEESARVRLFEQTQSAASWGITGKNAKSIAGQTVTAANVDEVKAALDFVSAQNALNDTLNSGTKVRRDVAAADKAGVDGAKGVVTAQEQLVAAQEQVTSSAKGVTKAQQAVSDATYSLQQAKQGLVRAHQAVSDAAYAEKKAHQGVTDAEDASTKAAQNLQRAKETLTKAQQDASRTLDLSTEAGRKNFAQLKTLSDAILAEYGPSADAYNRIIQQTADKFGISKQAAFDLAKQLHLIPQDFKFDMTAVASVDTASLQQVFKGTSAGGYYNDSRNVAKTVGGTGYAAGGPIFGAGGPRDDMVPLWASAGEWIHPVDSVDHYGTSFMEAVRTKKFPKFATGGPVDLVQWNAFGAGAGAAYIANVDAFTVMGLPHPPQLPAYVAPPPFTGGGVNVSGIRGDRAANRAVVLQVFGSMFGWGSPGEVDATDYLMMRESGYNNMAQNPTSTAFGAFQFLNSTWAGYGIPKTSDISLQAVAGGRYIRARYTDPIGAAAHERAFNWYANGDIINTPTIGILGEAGPEVVLPLNRPQRARQLADQAGLHEKHFHLTVYNAANSEINLRAQFKRLEIESGML